MGSKHMNVIITLFKKNKWHIRKNTNTSDTWVSHECIGKYSTRNKDVLRICSSLKECVVCKKPIDPTIKTVFVLYREGEKS